MNEMYEDLDAVYCSDETHIVGADGLLQDVRPFSEAAAAVYISKSRPSWMEFDGTVAENCPRNPGFEPEQVLGCFACGLSTISYGHGSLILTGNSGT